MFIQVKSLTYCIFATIVACQIPPGNYVITNLLVRSDSLSQVTPDRNEIRVIGRPQAQAPPPLSHWAISPGPSGRSVIRSTVNGKYLSARSNPVMLADQPYTWSITRQNDGSLTITSENPQLRLTLNQNSNPHSVIAVSAGGPATQWVFTPVS
ncbi:hypothetical protein CONCODRAFT_10658 [Conidiobolus coronatus NRRL 28638]|uniref:Ricin B lectin domain-containing protein n=1 Tax=Conidiobolus coronatus (strain ATCC 28846 / CBS 209.66 / NRRL 28638) TaxID=796925 RepID=A0A137NWW3_CONC2|nr:hypothetical protein CONCODRAFT_10658 [Conidiobolus coronatus NRRL 28638]|eukprot:KXN67313.1 hypothetical protein CONCODRAFT_10658 [Conidiobolus coronatus NRRL 28638]